MDFLSDLSGHIFFVFILLFISVVGNRFGNLAETTVSAGEVSEFEHNWNIPVVRVRNQPNSSNPGSITEVSFSTLRQINGQYILFLSFYSYFNTVT